MKFVKAKESVVTTSDLEKVKVEKKAKSDYPTGCKKKPAIPTVEKFKAKGRSLPKSQRGPKTQHFC